MVVEHPAPTEATVKYLYAHAFGCAYEGCSRPLYRVDEQTGVRTLNSRVCHINARREGGPRWNPNQSPEENRSEQNLVLMCVEHASTIDDAATLSAYPAERLQEWKRKQLSKYDRIRQGWMLDSDMAREASEASFSGAEITINNSNVDLGGEGGKAPSAGGGGGGAVGRNARGGRGGKGGDHRIDSGEYTLPFSEDVAKTLLLHQVIQQMILKTDFNPGAGGGGSGAAGDDAIAGDGGNGGDRITGVIDLAELRKAGLDHTRITVGRGGSAPLLPGQLGGSSEASSIEFFSGNVILKTVNAPGGDGAAPGIFVLPDGVEALSSDDISDGLRVTTLMTVNSVEVRDGVLFILGGDWSHFPIPHIPFDAVWPVVCTLKWRALRNPVPRGMFLSLFHPAGHEVSRQMLIIPVEAAQQQTQRWICPMGISFDAEGTWALRVHSGGFLMAEIDIQVLIRPSPI